MGVLTNPGQMQLTRMPCGPYSRATVRVSPTTPALAAEYAELRASPTRPAAEAVLRITPPPWLTIWGMAARIPR